MDEKPQRRWFCFGLPGLFALIAAFAVVASLWNPLVQPTGRSNLERVRKGMTEAEVAKLVGDPDVVEDFRRVITTRYQLTAEDVWLVVYKDGVVSQTFRRQVEKASGSLTMVNPDLIVRQHANLTVTMGTPNFQASEALTMLNPDVIVRQQD
jgi:hypothetical protein